MKDGISMGMDSRTHKVETWLIHTAVSTCGAPMVLENQLFSGTALCTLESG
jgi:hypothetical protein